MSEYGKKLAELRQQMERKTYLDSQLEQLNNEKSSLEYQLEPLEKELDKALKKVDRLEKSRLLNIFGNRNDKLDSAQLQLSTAKAAYNDVDRQIKTLKHDIQKLFNESTALSDSKRQYFNLLEQAEQALTRGNTDCITDNEMKAEKIALLKMKKQQLENVVLTGNKLIALIDNMISQSPALTAQSAEELRISLAKFRTAVGDVDKSSALRLETESDKKYINIQVRNQLRYGMSNDIPPLDMKKPLTSDEWKENLATIGYHAEKIVNESLQQLEKVDVNV